MFHHIYISFPEALANSDSRTEWGGAEVPSRGSRDHERRTEERWTQREAQDMGRVLAAPIWMGHNWISWATGHVEEGGLFAAPKVLGRTVRGVHGEQPLWLGSVGALTNEGVTLRFLHNPRSQSVEAGCCSRWNWGRDEEPSRKVIFLSEMSRFQVN